MCPDIKVSRNYKTKEKCVTDYVKLSFPDFIIDRQLDEGCSKKRPDMYWDLGSHILIIEIDEYRHKGYSCENKRIMQLSLDVGHRPVVFIRFNPDGYIDQDGKKISSCWKLNKQGIRQIEKSKQTEWTKRLDYLKQTIQYHIENVSEKTVDTIHLFY